MTTASVPPRRAYPGRSTATSRARVRAWLGEDHPVSSGVLVTSGLAALTGLFLLGYALVFLS